MSAWYNEHDPQKAAVLRELIREGVIAPGVVDERSITDVRAADLVEYTQCHFFAGIGVWSYAARLAGWPDDRPMWSASTPCPSFSAAGKGLGFSDPRHLWPEVGRLLGELSPAVLFGEQVASAIGHGWLDLVQADLEGEGYAVGKAVLGACSVGAPHIRQRLYFVGARPNSDGWQPSNRDIPGSGEHRLLAEDCGTGINCDSAGERSLPGAHRAVHSLEKIAGPWHGESERPGDAGSGAHAEHDDGWTDLTRRKAQERTAYGRDCTLGVDRHAISPRLEGHPGDERNGCGSGWLDAEQTRSVTETSATRGFWADCDWWYGRDGKYRPIEPGVFPLAHGAAARVLALRCYGDAIVPQAAEAWIRTSWETICELTGK